MRTGDASSVCWLSMPTTLGRRCGRDWKPESVSKNHRTITTSHEVLHFRDFVSRSICWEKYIRQRRAHDCVAVFLCLPAITTPSAEDRPMHPEPAELATGPPTPALWLGRERHIHDPPCRWKASLCLGIVVLRSGSPIFLSMLRILGRRQLYGIDAIPSLKPPQRRERKPAMLWPRAP